MIGDELLRLDGVRRSVSLPDGSTLPILQNVTLSVAAGEHLAIVGRSGSGKSTLLNILGLLDTPTSGRYLIDGADAGSLSARRRGRMRGEVFGFVFQQFNLLPRRTAAENVAAPLLYARGADFWQRRRRALDALERVGLSHRAASAPEGLSGGEQQRVAIARAIVRSPRVLLADEPTGSLDVDTGAAVMDLLQEGHGDDRRHAAHHHPRPVGRRPGGSPVPPGGRAPRAVVHRGPADHDGSPGPESSRGRGGAVTGLVGAFSEAWGEVRVHRARVVLSLVGVVIAVFAMTIITAAGEIGRQVVLESVERSAGRSTTLSINAYPTDGIAVPDERMAGVLSGLVDRFGVEHSSTVLSTGLSTEQSYTEILMVEPDYGVIHRIDPVGRWLVDGDSGRLSPAAVVNETMLEQAGMAGRLPPFSMPLSGTDQLVTVVGVVDLCPYAPIAYLLPAAKGVLDATDGQGAPRVWSCGCPRSSPTRSSARSRACWRHRGSRARPT